MLDSGATERNVGLFFVMASIMLLGIALFSSLIHIKNSKIIWVLGSFILFAGIYFAYNAGGVSFWSESIVSNTTILGASMMLYMFFLAVLTAYLMTTMRRVGRLTVILLGVANAVFFILPMTSEKTPIEKEQRDRNSCDFYPLLSKIYNLEHRNHFFKDLCSFSVTP